MGAFLFVIGLNVYINGYIPISNPEVGNFGQAQENQGIELKTYA
jgi:hypothetical protein